jgi:hypothetical protein
VRRAIRIVGVIVGLLGGLLVALASVDPGRASSQPRPPLEFTTTLFGNPTR